MSGAFVWRVETLSEFPDFLLFGSSDSSRDFLSLHTRRRVWNIAGCSCGNPYILTLRPIRLGLRSILSILRHLNSIEVSPSHLSELPYYNCSLKQINMSTVILNSPTASD